MKERSLRAVVRRVFVHYFTFCCFAGIICLDWLVWLLGFPEEPETVAGGWKVLAVVALLNGAVIAAAATLAATACSRRKPGRGTVVAAAAAVGWVGGVVVVPFYIWWQTMLLVTLVVALMLAVHLRFFLRTVRRILSPRVYPTWTDVARLAHVYLTVLAAVTLINTSLALLHESVPGWGPAYVYPGGQARSVIDAFYFSVVVMTTLGFGDIRPVSLDAKLVVSLECLVSYVMLALMIGCITRGVVGSTDGISSQAGRQEE